MAYTTDINDLRVRIQQLMGNLPAQDDAAYAAKPSEVAKYNTALINDKVTRHPEVLETRMHGEGPTLREYATTRGYQFGENGITPLPAAPAGETIAPTASAEEMKSLFERRVQQHEPKGSFAQHLPEEGAQSRALQKIMRAEGGGPIAKLKNKLKRTGGAGFGSGAQGRYDRASSPTSETSGYTALGEMLAEKIKAQNGEQSLFAPAEIVNMLIWDKYLEPIAGSKGRLQTTEKASKDGVLRILHDLPIPDFQMQSGGSVGTLNKASLTSAIQSRRSAFISIYQLPAKMKPEQVTARLKSIGHLAKSNLIDPPDESGKLPITYYKISTALENVLAEHNVATQHSKEEGAVIVAQRKIDKLLGDKPRALDALIKEQTRLTNEEIVEGLAKRGWVQKAVYRDNNPATGRMEDRWEYLAMNNETAHILGAVMGVQVEDRNGSGYFINKESLLNVAFDGDELARDRALKNAWMRDRGNGVQR